MALAKITLQLGKKKIELTKKEFEELKQDMRQLDKDHHYYWYNYQPYWNPAPMTFTTTTCGNADVMLTDDMTQSITASPPDFTGSVVSYTAQ